MPIHPNPFPWEARIVLKVLASLDAELSSSDPTIILQPRSISTTVKFPRYADLTTRENSDRLTL